MQYTGIHLDLLKVLTKEERLKLIDEQISLSLIQEEFHKKKKEFNDRIGHLKRSIDFIPGGRNPQDFINETVVPDLRTIQGKIDELIDFHENFKLLLNTYNKKLDEFRQFISDLYLKHEIERQPEGENVDLLQRNLPGPQAIHPGTVTGLNIAGGTIARRNIDEGVFAAANQLRIETPTDRAPW